MIRVGDVVKVTGATIDRCGNQKEYFAIGTICKVIGVEEKRNDKEELIFGIWPSGEKTPLSSFGFSVLYPESSLEKEHIERKDAIFQNEEVTLLQEAIESLKKLIELGTTVTHTIQLSTLQPGETFKIGKHDFIVLEQMPGQTAVISKGFIAEKVVFDEETTDYNNSNLKKTIETEIQPVIEKEVGADNLVEHEVDLTTVDMQKTNNNCRCKVRPITFDEARKYNDFLPNEDLDDCWWTCTPWSSSARGWKYRMSVVSPSGDFSGSGCDYDFGVRPFCILKSDIFVAK